ncbi:bacteriohemerythrin [Desulfopila aestuarii]|uniref:Hemerythrin n=1 Tax=Desulfopila aestuarii DSM 18488 TaxID=1121416 RepID=A0A1M7YJX8_9BACT|nr:bacteriohemerythrin [Desulfopila aestuarii]SHO52930.1 hemerythrin [Desulfopila aestuarii DSM 18488]
MKWSNEYRIGIAAIDAQHKRLFELIQELTEALHSGLRGSDVARTLEALDQYKTRHFQLEEKYMRESGYPGLEEQQKAHVYFGRRFAQLQDSLKDSGLTLELMNSIQDELSQWVTEHVTGLDKKFGKFYQDRSQ